MTYRDREIRSRDLASKHFRVARKRSPEEERRIAENTAAAKADMVERQRHIQSFQEGESVQTPDGVGRVDSLLAKRGAIAVAFRGRRYPKEFAATMVQKLS